MPGYRSGCVVTPTLVCTTRHELPVAHVRVDGQLSLATAPRLRACMLKCLAEQPTAVIVELESVAVVDELALTVFRAVVRRAAAWPGIPLLLCTDRHELTSLLRRMGIDRHVTVCASPREARELAARRPPPARVREWFPPVSASVPVARALVAGACRRWELPGLLSAAELVTSELVGNAVVHAGTPVDLTVTRWSRFLHLAVRDYDQHRPRRVGTSGAIESSGRGLVIVDAVASSWGCSRTGDGKVTWASLALPASS